MKAEETLMAAALGKRPPLTLDECRELANLIGKPELTPAQANAPKPAGWLVDEGFMLTDPQDKYAVPLYAHPPVTDSPLHAEIVVIGDKVMETQVRQKQRIEALEAALKPFAEMATAVEENMPAKDDRWALVRVRDKAITHADLKRARDVMDNGGSE